MDRDDPVLPLTRDAFLERYHAYRTPDPVAAARAARGVQVADEEIVVVRIGDEYCLMLLVAVGFLMAMGLGHVIREVIDPRRILEGTGT